MTDANVAHDDDEIPEALRDVDETRKSAPQTLAAEQVAGQRHDGVATSLPSHMESRLSDASTSTSSSTPRRESVFVSRPELDELLALAATAQRRQAKMFAVLCNGDGASSGSGKTTLAREFARRLRADGLFGGKRLWLELRGASQSTPTLRARAVQAAQMHAIEICGIVRADMTLNEAYQRALADVELLVIDDVGNSGDLRELLPSSSTVRRRSRCIVVTSRRALVVDSKASTIKVGALSVDSAICLLRSFQSTTTTNDDPSIDTEWQKIAVMCGFNALALTIVGSTIAAQGGLSTMQSIVEALQCNERRVDDPIGASIQWAYCVLEAPLQRVLQLAAIFPFSLSLRAFGSAFEIDASTALQTLRARGWLSWSLVEQRFAVHDAVRKCVDTTSDALRRPFVVDAMCDYLIGALRLAEAQYWTHDYLLAIDALLSEMNGLLWFMESDKDRRLLSVTVAPYGVFNVFVGVAHRKAYFGAIAGVVEFERFDRIALVASSHYAWALADDGQRGLALRRLRNVIARQRELLGAHHRDIFLSQLYLGAMLCDCGQFLEADVLSSALLPILERHRGPEHWKTLMAKHNLALAASGQHKRSVAIALFRGVLTMRERMLGTKHPETLASKHYLEQEMKRQR